MYLLFKNLTYLLVSIMTIRSVIWTPVCPTRFQFRSPIWSRWCSISTTRLDVTHVLNAGSYPWDGSPKHFLLNNISFFDSVWSLALNNILTILVPCHTGFIQFHLDFQTCWLDTNIKEISKIFTSVEHRSGLRPK